MLLKLGLTLVHFDSVPCSVSALGELNAYSMRTHLRIWVLKMVMSLMLFKLNTVISACSRMLMSSCVKHAHMRATLAPGARWLSQPQLPAPLPTADELLPVVHGIVGPDVDYARVASPSVDTDTVVDAAACSKLVATELLRMHRGVGARW